VKRKPSGFSLSLSSRRMSSWSCGDRVLGKERPEFHRFGSRGYHRDAACSRRQHDGKAVCTLARGEHASPFFPFSVYKDIGGNNEGYFKVVL